MAARRLLTALDDAMPRIEYRHFQLTDQDSIVEPPYEWAQSSQLAVPAAHGVLLRTGGNDFYPTVRLEVWSAEPEPQDASRWEAVEEADFQSVTGTLLLKEWDGGPVGNPVCAGQPGTYRLRTHWRGRAQAEALIGEELYYEGVEEWLLQVWPLEA
ncbi:hypothetical protein ACIHCX_35370 [Streptomyces sp. NPDC052043]|uniref:hypothetical protein n=1 Tax=Streptomyces sp. NPDC052043 TaxID=3365684 RepID=UPI0037D28E9A